MPGSMQPVSSVAPARAAGKALEATVDQAQTTGGDNPGIDDAADGPNDADSQDAPSASGGCSTAPRGPSLGMWVILLMGALGARRKST